ncbi:MAG: DUF1194 domain-containing protein [Gammaproteobacteria bacterium]|nr:DUF1194 domain-containing protein [Gammaproteobacteria bacterium]
MRTAIKAAVLLTAVMAGMGAGVPRSHAESAVDLQLVLAIDASASVDPIEFALQMSGIAAGFRDQEVIAAIGSGPLRRIAVSAVIWAESGWPKDSTRWYILDSAESAGAFALLIESYPRRIEGGTGIGSAILHAAEMFDGNGFVSQRRVIDLSGDGRETTFREWRVPPTQARNVALARGITVNGLAILTDEPDLDDYYRDEVIGGFGAFVITANSIDDFARAMRKKLLREIEYEPTVSGAAHRVAGIATSASGEAVATANSVHQTSTSYRSVETAMYSNRMLN